MEIFSYVEEEQGPEYIAFITDSGRIITWVPKSKDRKWNVHLHGESWINDGYASSLDDALNRIVVPNSRGMDIAAQLREIHGCDPFEVPDDD